MSPGLNAALPHLLKAAADDLRRVADIVNISSIAGRVAWADYGVYNMTKFGVNGFTEALRQEVTKKRVRVGVLEPGGSRHGPGGRSGSGRRVGSGRTGSIPRRSTTAAHGLTNAANSVCLPLTRLVDGSNSRHCAAFE
jgi:NAD(P)-dependent dehydrogenase (short-subunit alcohol dehydrogenase family)